MKNFLLNLFLLTASGICAILVYVGISSDHKPQLDYYLSAKTRCAEAGGKLVILDPNHIRTNWLSCEVEGIYPLDIPR